MRIGIDISQIVYEGSGVALYVRALVRALLKIDRKNSYVLFGASFRKREIFEKYYRSVRRIHPDVQLVSVPIPPAILDFLWNRIHREPVEKFTGPLDIFWSSDWTQPPLAHAKAVTTIHDLTPIKYPKEMGGLIREVHRRRLKWVRQECKVILCDSESTKRDVRHYLSVPEDRLRVVYPGL